MEIKTGYLYFLKDEFYKKVKDDTVMSNKGIGHSRPTYLTIKEKDILWFIPLSRQVNKYKTILEKKKSKQKSTDYILIKKIDGNNSVILIQNAFPTIEKYVDKQYTRGGKPIKVPDVVKREILEKFKKAKRLKLAGIETMFTDIVKLEKMMREELEKN